MILFSHPEAPPPLEAVVKDSALIAGFSQSLPPLEFYQARDGQKLAYRLYEGRPGRGVVIAVHGSTGSSIAMHAIAAALQAHGHTVYAIDLRGHGESGKLGDVSYIDQPLDDLADLLDKIDGTQASEKKILLGHSSGGTFALKVAADRLSRQFDGFVALSPPLGASKSTNQAQCGWLGQRCRTTHHSLVDSQSLWSTHPGSSAGRCFCDGSKSPREPRHCL
jgi:alpha-beta hydrolase superfamily lysophospholipase